VKTLLRFGGEKTIGDSPGISKTQVRLHRRNWAFVSKREPEGGYLGEKKTQKSIGTTLPTLLRERKLQLRDFNRCCSTKKKKGNWRGDGQKKGGGRSGSWRKRHRVQSKRKGGSKREAKKKKKKGKFERTEKTNRENLMTYRKNFKKMIRNPCPKTRFKGEKGKASKKNS